MNIEGLLRIDLYPLAGQLNRVSIQSSRPLQAAQIFEGKTPQAVLMQLPLLFSVCGIAQATAAMQAFQHALALAETAPVDAARALLLQMETAREHLWRILIDWPELLEESAGVRQAAPLQPLLLAFRKALFADGAAFSLQTELRVGDSALHEQIDRLDEMLASLVFGCSPTEWLRIGNTTELDDWSNQAESIAARLLCQLSRDGWQGLGATESGFLPDLPAADLNRRLGAPDVSRFIAAPLWQGSSWETTPLARQYDCVLIKALHCEFGNGLLTRLVARLVELARIPAGMRTLAAQLNSPRPAGVSGVLPAGTGIGQVEAARGRLVHRVVLDDGYVGRYQILAPTEWNFHPAGVVARGLASLPDTDKNTLRRQAAMLVSSVDPCVGYDLQVH